jgi:hypothetical protein
LLYKKLVNVAWKTAFLKFWWLSEILEELKDEAEAEFDARIMGYINKFKNRLIRADEWKWWAHGSWAAVIIEREIFEKVKWWKQLKWKDRLKAAWYLLYALEKWPCPYFRALGNYEWSGY